jgi:hypothetical protein
MDNEWLSDVVQVKIAYLHRPGHLLLVDPREAGCAHE